jgi:hypothetical protein
MPNRPTADRFHAPPERSPDFDHLSLDGLRRYRSALGSEEGRVSYWRRIIQARLDLVRAADSGATATVEDLREMFSEERLTGTRTALITVVPIDDMPPLPDLADLWSRQPVAGDEAHNAALIRDLSGAEVQLSAYRAALHRRLSSATTELIARYRESPELCLNVLPIHESSTPKAASQ